MAITHQSFYKAECIDVQSSFFGVLRLGVANFSNTDPDFEKAAQFGLEFGGDTRVWREYVDFQQVDYKQGKQGKHLTGRESLGKSKLLKQCVL